VAAAKVAAKAKVSQKAGVSMKTADKAKAADKTTERSKGLNTRVKAGRANSTAVQPAAKEKPAAKAKVGKAAVRTTAATRPAAVAKTIRSDTARGEEKGGSTARRGEKAASTKPLSGQNRSAAKKRAIEDRVVQTVAAAAPGVIDLAAASKRQATGRAFLQGRAALNQSGSGDEQQKKGAKKIEKKASIESSAEGRPAAEPAAVQTIAPTPSPAAAPAVAAATAAPAELKSAPLAVNRAAKSAAPPRQSFKPNDFIVYPAHGVGQIVAIEEQEVAGFKLELYVILFVKDKMILKVPTPKVATVGMRKLAEADLVRKALDTLTGRARIKRTMWSRRAQEYEAKINSGDLISIAEVVRDLYRSDAQPEQSYSERQLYEAALDRMAREVVIVQKLTETETLRAIEAQLQKGPRRGKPEEIEAEEPEAEIEEAA
jgi:CarD family transcriptional regulator